MAAFIVRRLLALIPVLLLVSILIFNIMHLIPGDPIDVMYGTEGISDEVRAALEHKLGLDQPILIQYFRWLGRLVTGDWGVSFLNGQPVFNLVVQKLPATLLLAISSMIVALLVSLPLGIIAAVNRNTTLDYLAMLLALLGISVPGFWMGIMLVLLFSLKLRWLPSIGFVNPFQAPLELSITHISTAGEKCGILVSNRD